MQTKYITNMKLEWADGLDQVLITHVPTSHFIFNLHRYVFYFQFAAQFLVCMYYI